DPAHHRPSLSWLTFGRPAEYHAPGWLNGGGWCACGVSGTSVPPYPCAAATKLPAMWLPRSAVAAAREASVTVSVPPVSALFGDWARVVWAPKAMFGRSTPSLA